MTRLATLGLVALCACTPRELKIATEPFDEGAIAAVFPPDGAMRLEGDVPVKVILGAAGRDRQPLAVATLDDDDDLALACEQRFDGVLAECERLRGVSRDDTRDVAIEIFVDEDADRARGSTALPRATAGWDLLEGMTLERLGGNAMVLGRVEEGLEDTSIFATIDGWEGGAHRGTLLAGPAQPTGPAAMAIASPGLTTLMDVEVAADGWLHAEAERAWLSIRVLGEPVNVLVLDLTIDGRIDEGGLSDAVLEGNLPALSVVMLTEPLGAQADEALHLVTMDVDRDGDGRRDSARLRLAGESREVRLAAWDE